MKSIRALSLILALWVPSGAAAQGMPARAASHACAECIRANMQFLASDALKGRESASDDELVAAVYIASELQRAAIGPVDGRSPGGMPDLQPYLQDVAVRTRTVTAPPELSLTGAGRTLKLVHGIDFHVFRISGLKIAGKLYREKTGEAPPANDANFYVFPLPEGEVTSEQIRSWQDSLVGKAAAMLVPMPARIREYVQSARGDLPSLPSTIEGVHEPDTQRPVILYLEPAALEQVRSMPDGTSMLLTAESTDSTIHTRNVVGVLRGNDPKLAGEAILLSAHLDHIGIGKPVNGDAIYNGADDDASGVAAVLEIARALARGAPTRRTIIFALFGSEEKGLWGSTYFREHPPVPLANVIANLSFEMIALPDPAVEPDSLWLTGWDRSDLGPQLAKQGARLTGDPHPDQNFFERSDNYALATKGVVAHTVSSYGLHNDYHQPSDDLSHVDWRHLIASIASMIEPIRWLANSDFRPQWVEGKKPSE